MEQYEFFLDLKDTIAFHKDMEAYYMLVLLPKYHWRTTNDSPKTFLTLLHAV